MSSLHSFEGPLRLALSRLRPRRVVEWGPGLSTGIIANHEGVERLHSIEHDEKWFRRAKEQFEELPNVRLHLRRSCKRHSRYPWLAVALSRKGGPFDLAFVDGRRRVECVLAALASVRPGGEVLLHDAEREQYIYLLAAAGIVPREITEGTAIFVRVF